jgi:hypothetical protein
MFPRSAVAALEQIKAMPDHNFLEFAIERECHGATPYLSGRTDQGWSILWHVDMLGD